MTDLALDRVILGIYEAALAPALWTSVLIDVRDLFSAQLVSLIPMARPAELVVTPGFEAAQRGYRDYWWQHDELTLAASRGESTGRISRDWEAFSSHAIERDPYYQEFRRPSGLGHLLGYAFETQVGEMFGLGVQLPADRMQIPDAEANRQFAMLARHIERVIAVSVRMSLDGTATDLGTTLSALPCGIALLDHQGRVVFANASFEAFAPAGLRVERRIVRTPQLLDQPKLDALIRDSLGPRTAMPDIAAVAQRGDKGPLLIRALGLPATDRVAALDPFRPRACLMLLVTDPREERGGRVDFALQSFGLTPAETRAAVLIGSGKSVPEVADLLGISHHTVRSQVKAAMAKLGVSRQGELVALVTRLSSVLSAKP